MQRFMLSRAPTVARRARLLPTTATPMSPTSLSLSTNTTHTSTSLYASRRFQSAAAATNDAPAPVQNQEPLQSEPNSTTTTTTTSNTSPSNASNNNNNNTKTITTPAWIHALRDTAKAAEKNISYDIRIYNDMAWRRKTFTFSKEAWDPNTMSAILRSKLCLGKEEQEYTVIGEAFPFPDKNDSPVINEPQFPCLILWDHNSSTEKVMIQLSPHFPPLLWITVKPTLEALKRVFAEFIDVDAQHMKKYLPYYENVQHSLESASKEKFGETLSNVRMKDKFIEDMRQKDPRSLEMDWDKEYSFYMGNTEHFRVTEDKMMKQNPFVFGWPLLVGDGNHHLEGTPFRMSAFRTIYSKSMLLINSRLDLQLDHRQSQLTAGDDPDIILEMPIFCTVNYTSNKRLSGGSALVERFNKVMNTSFPSDMPIDVLACFAREATLKGVPELLEELKFLDAASKKAPDVERVVRLSQDMLSTNRIIGQLAYTIVYLAIAGYDEYMKNIFDVYYQHPADMVRVACAKGAHIMGCEDRIKEMVAAEPEGRMKLMLQRCMIGAAGKVDKNNNNNTNAAEEENNNNNEKKEDGNDNNNNNNNKEKEQDSNNKNDDNNNNNNDDGKQQPPQEKQKQQEVMQDAKDSEEDDGKKQPNMGPQS